MARILRQRIFSTWAGTVQAFLALKSIGCCETKTEAKKKIVEAIDIVSDHLGNTRSVCKKYYVHPLILSFMKATNWKSIFGKLDEIEKDDGKASLSPEEKMVMKILETN